jgi:hypothetical protein
MNKQQVLKLINSMFAPHDLPHVLVVGSVALLFYDLVDKCNDVDLMVLRPEILEGLLLVGGEIKASKLNGAANVSFNGLDAFYDPQNSYLFDNAVLVKYNFLLPQPSNLLCWYKWVHKQTNEDKYLKHVYLVEKLVR